MTLDINGDPRVWSEAASNLSSAALVVVTMVVVLSFVLLLWRGSEKLGIPGAGVEIRLAREALMKDREEELAERKKERELFAAHFKEAAESDKRLRRDFRSVMTWIATTLGREPPELEPPEDSDPSIAPPPLAKGRGASSPDLAPLSAPASRRGQGSVAARRA
jgi:hypothetical protein